MKNLFKSFLLFGIIGSSTISYSQSSLTKDEAAEYIERFNTAEGTYQIQVIDTRELPAIPVSFIDDIEKARDENEVRFISLKENIRVKILPTVEINSENFKPLDRIVFINSSDL